MATFQAQVEGITSLSVGTTPTTGELTQFLTDGVRDVINRIIAINPDEIPKFTVSTSEAGNDGVIIEGEIISVVREHDSATILRPCTQINPMDRYEATDTDSLKYRSKYNPGFYQLNGKVFLVPITAGGNNAAIVTQVDYPTADFNDVSINNFPDEYEYLVVLYTSMRCLHANASSVIFSDPDVGRLDVSVTLPTAPTFTAVVYDDAETGTTSTTEVTLPVTAPSYTAPDSPAPERPNFELSIEAEDVELVSAKVQQYSADLAAYQAEITDAVNKFNEETALYQAGVQKAVADAQVSNTALMQDSAASNNVDLQNKTQGMQVIINDNTRLLQNWQAELAVYQADVQSVISEYQADTAVELQRYQAEFTEKTTQYQWYVDQYTRLKLEYDSSFERLRSATPPAPEGREARA